MGDPFALRTASCSGRSRPSGFWGTCSSRPWGKEGARTQKNISLYPVTLISAWKWGADLSPMAPSSTSTTKLSGRLHDHVIVYLSQLSVEFNHWWRQNKSCQRDVWVFKIKHVENTGKLYYSLILFFFCPRLRESLLQVLLQEPE